MYEHLFVFTLTLILVNIGFKFHQILNNDVSVTNQRQKMDMSNGNQTDDRKNSINKKRSTNNPSIFFSKETRRWKHIELAPRETFAVLHCKMPK